MLKKDNTVDIVGTCLQGYIRVSYAELVEAFGEPSHDGDGYKVDAEWELSDDEGNVVTIYNYKDGPNYCGGDGTPVKEIRDWHIGGRNKKAVELVRESVPAGEVTEGW